MHQQNLVALSQLVEKVNHAYPGSGLAHFWTLPDMQGGDSGELVNAQVATESDIVDGLMLLARKLVIGTSIPQSAHDLQAIHTKSSTFRNFVMSMSLNRSLTNSCQTSLKRKHPSKVTACYGKSSTMVV